MHMPFAKLFSSIKNFKRPCYLNQDEDELNPHICFDDKLCCKAKILSTFEIYSDSFKGPAHEPSPMHDRFAGPLGLMTPGNISLDHLSRRNVAAQRKRLAKKFFHNDQVLKTPRIRSGSLERVMPSELCMFSRHAYTIKAAKKECNLSLWYLLEATKEIYKAQRNYALQNLIQDFGSLVLYFMFSPLRRLRFDQFKNIVEKLEEIENTVQERLEAKQGCMSAIQLNGRDENHNFLNLTERSANLDRYQSRHGPSSVAKLMPEIFGSYPVKINEGHLPGFRLKNGAPSDDKVLYKKLGKVVSKAKFLISHIGHLLHYEQLASDLSDFLLDKESRKKSLAEFMSFSVDHHKEKPSNNYHISMYPTAYKLDSLPSIALEEDRHTSIESDASLFEAAPYSNRLSNFLFESRSYIDDFDEEILKKRLDKLHKYSIYKAKKWVALKKKAEVQQKYEKFEIVCKICEQKVNIDLMKEHSRLCCIKAEANKEMRESDRKLGEWIFEAFMRAKELETSIRLSNKHLDKLKAKYRGSTSNVSEAAKKVNAGLIRDVKVKSPVISHGSKLTSLRASKMKRFKTVCHKEPQALMPRSQTDGSKDLKNTVQQLNQSYMHPEEDISPESGFEELNLDIDNDKDIATQNMNDDPIILEDGMSEQNEMPKLELQIHKSSSGALLPRNQHAFHSDPLKCDFETETSDDSKNTDNNIPYLSLNLPTLKSAESCAGSDDLPNTERIEGYSNASIKSSPSKSTSKPFSTKKSKFYREKIFNFENSSEDYTKKDNQIPEDMSFRLTEEMAKLKLDITQKKEMKKAYDFIMKEGKAMINREPYNWMMEKSRDDTHYELSLLLSKVDDQEIKTFRDNFFTALDKRIKDGKLYRDTKKLLDNLGNPNLETLGEKPTVEKLTIMRANSVNTQLQRNYPGRSLGLKEQAKIQKSTTMKNVPEITETNSQYFDLSCPESPRNQTKCGEDNNLSASFYLEDMEKDFDNANNKSRESKDISDTSIEKQNEDTKVPTFPQESLVPSSISDVSAGCNTFNNLESFRLIGEDEDRTKSSPFQSQGIPKPYEDQNLGETAKEAHDFEISIMEIKPNLSEDHRENCDSFSANNTSDKKAGQGRTDFKENIFHVDRIRLSAEDDEKGSPDTPGFKVKDPVPLIWRTTTAPTRPILDLSKIMRKVPGEEDSENQSQSQSHRLPQHSKMRDLVKISKARKRLQEMKQQSDTPHVSTATSSLNEVKDQEGEKKSSVLHNKFSKLFAEDIMERAEIEEKCESPVMMSPGFLKGYYSDSQAKNMGISSKKNQAFGMENFEPVKLISKGAFGRVWLVRRKATNDLYAMKVINLAEKAFKNTQDLENLRKENKIFGIAQEDFVVRALFTFTHGTCVCFVMEYMTGGDFGDILYTYSALDEDVARFYIAEIVLALEYLHSLGIVHRDLKPDNILLDKTGHAKLTDFGLSESGLSQIIKKKLHHDPESPMVYQRRITRLSKLCSYKRELDGITFLKAKEGLLDRKIDSIGRKHPSNEEEKEKGGSTDNFGKKKSKKAHRLIGTPDYMAPEIIQGISINNFSIDWWSLGVMLFEFLCGVPPFNDDSPDKIFENIVRLKVPWDQINIGYGDDCMSPDAADLIKKLLVLDHTKRLGANGAQEIKQHQFFRDINWETLRKEPAKIIPEQKHETDTDNFTRMGSKITDKEKESPFEYLCSDLRTSSNAKVAKELLEASLEKFYSFNSVALDFYNRKSAEEALKEKERVLNEFKKEEPDTKKIYDDIFDTPK